MKKRRNCTECHFCKCKEECMQERREFPNSIAKAVYEARDKLKMSQAEFAVAIGIMSDSGQALIAMMERGTNNRKPTAIQALNMSKISGFPIERFIVETDDTVLNGDIDIAEEESSECDRFIDSRNEKANIELI